MATYPVSTDLLDPPQWAVDYWVDLSKRELLESVLDDIRRFVRDEMYVERSLVELTGRLPLPPVVAAVDFR